MRRDLPMFTPNTHSGRCRLMFIASSAAPQLLNPARLISARSRGKRKSRGRGLPGCGSLVTEPTSIKPKPSADSACAAVPFLSKPAASPTGFAKVKPKRSSFPKGKGFWRPATNFLAVRELKTKVSECNASSCTVSGGRRKSIGRNTDR